MNLAGLICALLAGGGLAWLSERLNPKYPKWVAAISLVVCAGWLAAVWLVTPNEALLYGSQAFAWIPRFGIALLFEMDGLSLMMVALTLVLGLVAIISSWNEINSRTGFFHFNIMAVLAGVVGVFTAMDLFLFFVCWEVMLVPMYLLIAIWGHEARDYASMKFFLFTQVSGLLMLLSILVLVNQHYLQTGYLSFAYVDLLQAEFSTSTAAWLASGFIIAFIVKLPAVPVHTWLPDAHTQAPTAGSVILAGILLKTGAYGLIRFALPLFPEAVEPLQFSGMLLGAISVLYGGVMAYSQSDFKRLVAYSSIAHMGFVLIGVFAWSTLAVQGAVMQMVAHGFSTAALFMIAGLIQQRIHTREMSKMGGLWMQAPRMGAIALFFVVASLGMPGLGNFVGEFVILLAAFKVNVTLTVAATFGVVVAAVYSLSLMQRTFQGKPSSTTAAIAELDSRELITLVLLMCALVWLGVYPQPVFDLAAPAIITLGVP